MESIFICIVLLVSIAYVLFSEVSVGVDITARVLLLVAYSMIAIALGIFSGKGFKWIRVRKSIGGKK